MNINCTIEEIPNIIDDKEIEVLIIASNDTLKRQKNEYGKDEVSKLVKDAIEEDITRDIFDKTLDSLIESGSVKCSFIAEIDEQRITYDKIILLGDFNAEIDKQRMQSFCDNYSLKSLTRQPTCYKNFENRHV